MKLKLLTSGILLITFWFIQPKIVYAQAEPSISILSVTENESNRSIDVQVKLLTGTATFDKLEGEQIRVFQDQDPVQIIDIDGSEKEAGIYTLATRPENMFYTGEEHKLRVEWDGSSDNYNFEIGSLVAPFPAPQQFSWLDIMVLGLMIVSVLLLIMSESIPLYKKLVFRTKYVKPYYKVKTPGIQKHDPMSGDAFRDDELVVVRCRTMTSLETWTFQKHQCMYYPDCMYASNPCRDGESFTAYDRFFSQKGVYRKLNWLWLGSLGGVFAGLIWIAVKGWGNINLATSLLGMALGLGLTMGLAWAEERGQGRELSWVRILLRSLAGAAVGGLLFLVASFFPESYGVQLLIWSLFGAALGFVLSLNSSILALRGVLAGLVGSLVGFNIYYGLLLWLKNDSLAIVISLICFGAIMAIIMVTVINRLEDFELEVLSPPGSQRTFPISKWLKQQIDIFIGSDLNNYVPVKWNDDEAQPQHIRLSYDQERVYIEPLAETLLNGRRVPNNKKIPLNDGDVLQLGRSSISRMQYHERTIRR